MNANEMSEGINSSQSYAIDSRKKKMNLSVIILTKNEEKKIAKAIRSAQFADEVIVYDCGSNDQTVEIAQNLGAKVHIDPIWQGFGKQRNKAQKKAKCGWVLMLDADEIITPKLQKSIKKALKKAGENEVFQISRLTFVFGGYIRHGGWYPDWIIRLYKKDTHHYDKSLVHEKLVVKSTDEITRLKGDLLHNSYSNLQHYLEKSAHYANAWAESRVDKGKNFLILRGIGHGIFCFIRIYILKAGFLDGRAGFLISLLSGHSTFCKYIALWEKTKIKGFDEEFDEK